MKRYINPQPDEWPQILERPLISSSQLHEKVRIILEDIKSEGVEAVRRYTELFDGVSIGKFRVSDEEIEQACVLVAPELKTAIEKAAGNIHDFHAIQKPDLKKIETSPGVVCWQKAVAIDKVGLYIPGGSAPLFSTVLMLAIPAKIAGCREIVICTPPGKNGNVHPAILFAAKTAGVTKIFTIGGVQAIGAMAYGMEGLPRADKIFGPGNQYVMAAKQLVSINDTATDMPAGPSEVLVMADESAKPEFIASDLLSQAEHGPDSQVILVTNSIRLAEEVEKETYDQLEKLKRKEIASQALKNSVIIVLNNEAGIIDIVNAYAPEHLIIAMKNYATTAEKIINAGSVFLGNYTPESAGDYASGTNHTLPTNGWARSFSGVNLDSFMKKITFQEISYNGLKNLGPVIQTLAEAEQLDAHKNAVSIRLSAKNYD